VKVMLHHANGSAVTGQQLSLSLSRPGQPVPEGVPLREVSGGDYRASVELGESGLWVAVIRFAGEGKGIVLEHVVGQE
jgi:nitrogen fixation protein FixH